MSQQRIDFNLDLGEGFGVWANPREAELIRLASSVNVAAGFHAGDPAKIRETVELAKKLGVSVGAHPGLPDMVGFGRRAMAVTPRDVADCVTYQVGAVSAFTVAAGIRLHHVKLHGAMAILALENAPVAAAYVEAIAAIDRGLPIYTTFGSATWVAAERANVPVIAEFFADRPLRRDGSFVLPNFAESFGHESGEKFEPTPEFVAAQVRSILSTGSIPAYDGGSVRVVAGTMSIHADADNAVELAEAVVRGIHEAGAELSSELAMGVSR